MFTSVVVIHGIFIICLLSLLFELIVGGFLFGIIGITGIIYMFVNINYSILAIALAILGLFFIVLEAFKPAKALFFITGISICFISFLPYHIFVASESLKIILVLFLITSISFLFFLGIRKVRTLKYQQSIFSLIGKEGVVSINPEYAKVNGELWNILSKEPLIPGDKIIVLEQKDLVLYVRKSS